MTSTDRQNQIRALVETSIRLESGFATRLFAALQQVYGITPTRLRTGRRTEANAWPRQVGLYAARKCGLSLKQCADLFWRQHHRSTTYAMSVVRNRIETCDRDRAGVEAVIRIVKGEGPNSAL